MITARDFNLLYSVESGQPLTFYADYMRGGDEEKLSYVTQKGRITLNARQGGRGECLIDVSYTGDYTPGTAEREVAKRLSLDDDMERVYGGISTDAFMSDAVKQLYGMRVTNNDPWETTLCFLISQFNNIKRIRRIVRTLIERYGEERDGVRLFPKPAALAMAKERELMACGTGFRAKYIRSVARACTYGFDLNAIAKMNYMDAKEELMKLDGVGDKVADCILLMGYKKLEAFPIDVWIKRTMEKVYFRGRKKSVKAIHELADEKWRGYQGYAQQYLFHHSRSNKIGVER